MDDALSSSPSRCSLLGSYRATAVVLLCYRMTGDLGSVPSSALDSAYNPPAPAAPARLSIDTSTAALSPTATAVTAADDMDPAVLARLRRYIICFALVEFDLDTGVRLSRLSFVPSYIANPSLSLHLHLSHPPAPLHGNHSPS